MVFLRRFNVWAADSFGMRRRGDGSNGVYENRTWLEVDLDAIGRNYQTVKEHIGPDCQVIAVVKANAYSIVLLQLPVNSNPLVVPMFGVVCMESSPGIGIFAYKAPILVMR